MIVNKFFSLCAQEISLLIKANFLEFTGSRLCKWRTKQFCRRDCYRSSGVDVLTIARGGKLRFRITPSSEKRKMGMDEDKDLSDGSGGENVPQELFTQRRVLECTDYGRRLSNQRRNRNDTFSVVSYNVLAQSLLEAHPHLYRECSHRDLKWSIRFERLLREFQILNADVLCLQEVEEQHLEDYFVEELEQLGYQAIFKKRTKEKIDGCAIFYKTDKFDLVELKTVELFMKNIKLLDRDNIGIVALLAPKWKPEERIVVATTHLLYTPRRTDIRLTQTQCMLAEIEKMAYKRERDYWPIIYTGDMNFTPQSPVYELVRNGFIQYDMIIDRPRSYHGSPQILLPASVGITDSCQFADVLHERHGNGIHLVYGSGALDHNLRFHSVYNHVKNDLAEASTYQDQWHTVDYIFFSRRSSSSRLELVSRLGLPNIAEAASDLGRLPNRIGASDHLPLIATFHLAVDNRHTRIFIAIEQVSQLVTSRVVPAIALYPVPCYGTCYASNPTAQTRTTALI